MAAQIAVLEAALERSVPDPSYREFAGRPDPQGLGGPSDSEPDDAGFMAI